MSLNRIKTRSVNTGDQKHHVLHILCTVRMFIFFVWIKLVVINANSNGGVWFMYFHCTEMCAPWVGQVGWLCGGGQGWLAGVWRCAPPLSLAPALIGCHYCIRHTQRMRQPRDVQRRSGWWYTLFCANIVLRSRLQPTACVDDTNAALQSLHGNSWWDSNNAFHCQDDFCGKRELRQALDDKWWTASPGSVLAE